MLADKILSSETGRVADVTMDNLFPFLDEKYLDLLVQRILAEYEEAPDENKTALYNSAGRN